MCCLKVENTINAKAKVVMIKSGKISVYEGILFIITLIVSKILYTGPPAVVKQTGTAAWYTSLIACMTTVILFLVICKLMNRFPGKNIVEIYEIVLGKIIGRFIAFFFSGYALYFAAMYLREFAEMMKVYNLTDTPISLVLITFFVVTVLLSYKGLESIIRVCCINFYPILLGLVIILIAAYENYNFDYLKPYLGYGLKRTIPIGILRSSTFEEVTILLTITSTIHSIKDLKKIGLISIVISGIIFSIAFACYISAFQYTIGTEPLSGIYELARIIFFNRYVQRIESIFLFSWVISAVLTVSTSFYISIRTYCQIFKIKDHGPILLPFAILTYVMALIPKNVSEIVEIHLRLIRQYSCIFVYGIPILTLFIAIMLRKGTRETVPNK